MKSSEVKQWLFDVENRMRVVFARSNFYNVMPMMYGCAGGHGTAAMMILEDCDTAIRCFPFPIGSYMIALNDRLKCDTLYRELPMTIRQCVQQFGLDNCSQTIKTLWDRGSYETPVEITHAIEPNHNRATGMQNAKDKPFRSVYFESGKTDDTLLRESGFDEFPVMAPRWDVEGDDVYGYSPGMDALGLVKGLQFSEKRKAEALDKLVRPPMLADASLRTQRSTILPGDVTYMLEHAAHQINNVNAEGRKVEVTQAALALSNKLFRSIKGEADLARKSDGAASLLDKVKDCNLDISVLLPEFMFERFDGLKKVGPWHEFIWDRYNDAADHQIRLREMLFPKIMEYAHGKAIDRSMGKIHIDSINADLVKDDIIAIALNCGNESNLDKLMRGGLRFKGGESPAPLNEEGLKEILSHLSGKEIDVVNGIWKTIDTLKPEAAELARKRTGVEPNWIEALPMEIKNGTLEGGYYPVKYDARYSAVGEKQSDSSTLDQMFNKYASSSTRQGYMKERTSFAAPMSLDWQSIVSRHLDEVITDISHWQFATDTQRLLKRPEVKDAIHERLGMAFYKNLLDWVRYTVNQDNVSPEASDNIEKFRRQIRNNMNTYALGFKVANAVNETAVGIPLMMQQVRIASAFKGIMQYMRNPVEATRFAIQASDYMRNIDKSFDRDITQALNALTGRHTVVDDIRHWTIADRTFFWKIGAVMAWHAGYVDAQEQGLQGKAAVRIADSICRMTQGSGRAGDQSSAQCNPYMNELTQFIGPSLIQYNNRRAVMAFKDQGFNAQTATLGLTTLLAGHVANSIIFDLLRGRQPDDLEKLPSWILARLTLGLFDGIPVMRDIAGYAESKITGEKGKDLRLSPVLQWGKDAVDGVTKTVKAMSGDVDWHKAIIQDAKAVGGATGLPTLAGSTVGQYIYDVMSGDYKPDHPWSPVTDIFYARHKK
jgi:hypothetical protein